MTSSQSPHRGTAASNSFLKFVLTASVAAAINWSSRIVYNMWLPYSASIVIAFFTGLTTAFILAKLFVFRDSRHSTIRSMIFFALVNLVAIVQTLAVTIIFAYYFFPRMGMNWHTKDIAHLVGVCSPVFTSYIGHKYFSFRQ
ncbi:GtrA family protein [Paraburkholderia tropica]|uniref:GtrA family protein n=1 Tax=Paraburkholderia tropica TaxID=92647 RepID=UPI002ABDF578|nr:GtrA family protein [Paraburkholderia tropica]